MHKSRRPVRCTHMKLTPFATVCLLLPALSHAHEGGHDHHHAADADLRCEVAIVERDGQRIIEANGVPDHTPGKFPNPGNPHAITAQRYVFTMPLRPVALDRPVEARGTLSGVAINGVVFDPGTAEVWTPGQPIATRPGRNTRGRPDDPKAWNYESQGGMSLGIDQHHAHVQPSGAYHYHGLPTGLIERLRKERGADTMLLVGYAADGFPMYAQRGHKVADDPASPLVVLRSSWQLKKGNRPASPDGPGGRYDGTFVQDYEYIPGSGDLDECNGRTGVTPEYPEGTYHYVLTDTYPFVPRMFRGEPDPTFAKRRR